MKQVPRLSRKRRSRFPDPSPRDKQRIPDQRMSRAGEMNADLMGPPRLDPHLEQRGARSSLQDLDPAQRRPAGRAGGMDRTQAGMRHRTDGEIDGECVSTRHAAGQGTVDTGHLVSPQSRSESRPGTCCAGQQHDSRGAPPQPVDRSGFGIGLSDQGEEGVLEETSGRDRGKAAGLCHRQYVLVFMQDGISEGHIRLVPGRAPPDQALSRPEDRVRVRPAAIQADLPVLEAIPPGLRRRMTVSGGQVGQRRQAASSIVYPLPVFVSLIQGFSTCASFPVSTGHGSSAQSVPCPVAIISSP